MPNLSWYTVYSWDAHKPTALGPTRNFTDILKLMCHSNETIKFI